MDRDTFKADLLRRLDEMEPGDEISITMGEGGNLRSLTIPARLADKESSDA